MQAAPTLNQMQDWATSENGGLYNPSALLR